MKFTAEGYSAYPCYRISRHAVKYPRDFIEPISLTNKKPDALGPQPSCAPLLQAITGKACPRQGSQLRSVLRPWPTDGGHCIRGGKALRVTWYTTLIWVVPSLGPSVQAITAEAPDLLRERVVNLLDGTAPLHLAAGGGRTEAVRLLLELGADIEAEDGNGLTALRVRHALLNPALAECCASIPSRPYL